MLLYRSVKQRFDPDPTIVEKMRTFQPMVNDCVRMGFHCEDPSYQMIKSICRGRMLDYPIEDTYRFSAMFEAANLLKKSKNAPSRDRWGKPHCWNHSSPLAWKSASKGRAGQARGIRLGFNGLRAR